MGLSQAKLGELVGRSPSTIRSWERDDSITNDPDVLMALAAVLGVEPRTLFEKAGVDRPDAETSPTVQQELATLRPPSAEDAEDPDDRVQISFTYEELAGLGVRLDDDEEIAAPSTTPLSSENEDAEQMAPFDVTDRPVPGYTDPRPGYVVTRLTPADEEQVDGEYSYVEDPSERQLYRVRMVGTAVGVVILLLLLIYAAGKGMEAFGDWWDSFFGQLRL